MMTPGIDPTLFEPIGRVTVNFAMLQRVVETGVWQLLFGNGIKEQRTSQIVTAELSFRRAVELFSCLYRHRFPGQHEAALKTMCKRLLAAEEKRNLITHSTWAGGQPGYTLRFKTTAKQKGFAFQFQHMSRDDITAVGDGIAIVATDLQKFIFKFVLGLDL